MPDTEPKVPLITIPDADYYRENDLLPEYPEALQKKVDSFRSSQRPRQLLSELGAYPEQEGREYHTIYCEGSTWTYIVDEPGEGDPDILVPSQKIIQDLFVEHDGESTSLKSIASALGISDLKIIGLDREKDLSFDLAITSVNGGPDKMYISLPSTRDKLPITVHELSHIILERKLLAKYGMSQESFYLGADATFTLHKISDMYKSLIAQSEAASNDHDKNIFLQAAKRVDEMFTKSEMRQKMLPPKARWEFDVWFIAVQLFSEFKLENFAKRYSDDIVQLIQYGAFTAYIKEENPQWDSKEDIMPPQTVS